MRSSNPVLTSLADPRTYRESAAPASEAGFGAPLQQSERSLTIDDVVSKTAITIAIIVAVGAATVFLSLQNPGLGMILAGVGSIAGFITVLVNAFSKSFGSPVITILYAVFEGMLVGGISFIFGVSSSSGVAGFNGAIVGQAVVATIGVFIGMLFVYKVGAVRVTPKFTRVLTGMIVGVAVLMLVNLLTTIFFNFNLLRDGGMIAILFSLVCIVLAALSFLQDFDMADRLVRSGAPAKAAWGIALGLAVTLVWLYTEILRFLSYFTRD